MKNILSKKLVSAAIISGMSLIPFNTFAESSFSTKTELIKTNSAS